ncbi:uncharacterized protein N7446_010332 [Penicillium canescens]|nr:uncharacterized protein N7446_010332 [Penicillium canescens]KAJ6054320.1 hypothetical protein N7446_010332 [Penicillium canescens]
MSVCVVLAQFDSLVARMESFSSRLSTKRIRPTTDQLNEFQNLHVRFKAILADYDTGVERLLTTGLPDENDISIADRVRSDKDSRLVTSSTLTTLKRNIVLIFTGPKISKLDSSQVKTKNKQTESRCGRLRSQHSHVILMWAMALQPSTWRTSGGMTDKTFFFLMDDLQEERMKQIPPKISDTLQSLAEEEPLNTSDLFKKFIEDVRKSAVGQEESAVLRTTLKRKRITEIPKFSRQYELVDKDMRRGDSTNPELCQHAAGDMPKIQGGRHVQPHLSPSCQCLETGSSAHFKAVINGNGNAQ